MTPPRKAAKPRTAAAGRRPARTRTREVLDLLRDFESPNVTFTAPDGSWPIVWQRARGCHVWDIEGKRYLDLTAAFGVAAAGAIASVPQVPFSQVVAWAVE